MEVAPHIKYTCVRVKHESTSTTMESCEFKSMIRGYHVPFPHDKRPLTAPFSEHMVTGD